MVALEKEAFHQLEASEAAHRAVLNRCADSAVRQMGCACSDAPLALIMPWQAQKQGAALPVMQLHGVSEAHPPPSLYKALSS